MTEFLLVLVRCLILAAAIILTALPAGGEDLRADPSGALPLLTG
jgi:hypothetical protein